MSTINTAGFPEQAGPEKVAGTHNDRASMQEKYVRETADIEDLPEDNDSAGRKNIDAKKPGSTDHLTDESGEEKKEDYINTDERKKDLDQTGKGS